jgi:glycosyltransferase involved in cell wall biosynthesis
MKIAVIGPPWIPVPPVGYGGIELVVYNLVEGLTHLGEQVTLFAPKGSRVSSELITYIEHPEDFGLASPEREKRFVAELSSKYAYALAGFKGVDIIHDHTLSRPKIGLPVVYTLHGPANANTVRRCVELSKDPLNHFVAISNRQKEHYLNIDSRINFAGTVYNSVDTDLIRWNESKDDYFLFVGRANWEKGLDLAIRAAAKAKVGLVMAVKMSENFEKEYFKREIQPLLDRFSRYLSFEIYTEINRASLFELYRKARCTLFTSQWEEPFGLVMIESMACGTPVIALSRGAAPEIIVDGKTGFLVGGENEMVETIKKIKLIKPAVCRRHIETNFSRKKMAADYLRIYDQIMHNADIVKKI